jgi:hypothetical protein
MDDEVDLEDLVTIHKDEYEELLQASKWLVALESAGVDNWHGIDFARELHGEEDDESIPF